MNRINIGKKKKKSGEKNEYQSKNPRGSERWRFEKPLKFPVVIVKPDGVLPEVDPIAPILPNPVEQPTIAVPIQQSFTPVDRPVVGIRDAKEVAFCQKYAKAIGGECEFPNPVGRIDILTEDAVIEVKLAHNWKHGIGQVLVYASYFPNRQPVLLLLDDTDGFYGKMAQHHCDRLNINLESKFTN